MHMRRALAACFAVLLGSQPAALGAQQSTPLPSVESLGVSFDRIKRQLDQKAPTKDKNGLKLEFYVEVVAEAPPFQLFLPGESSFGPVPGVAPSHADMMRHITPQAFAAPAATLVSFGGKGGSPKLAGQDFWETQSRMAQEVARRKKADAERERQRRLKESVVVSPPKSPGGSGAPLP
jgi:hypothetical protein